MSQITGTQLIAPIVPFDSNDSFPTHYDTYGKGGFRCVNSVEERNSIPLERQKIGMTVYVEEVDNTFQLTSTGILSDDNWKIFLVGPTGSQGITGPAGTLIQHYHWSGIIDGDPIVYNISGLSFDINSVTGCLFDNPDYSGMTLPYFISGSTFTAEDNCLNYLYIDYNNGTPVYKLSQNIDDANFSDNIMVNTILASNGYLHFSHWDRVGDGLPNKLHKRFIKTQRYSRESGLALSTGPVQGVSGQNTIIISDGVVWRGVREFELDTVYSNGDNNSLWFFYRTTGTNGGWISTVNNYPYNYTQYDNRLGSVVTMTNNNKHNINWVYRGVEDHNHGYYVLSDKQYDSVADAIAETKIPSVPLDITNHAILVGRIICKRNTSTPVWIEGSFDTQFVGTVINNHNSLSNLQGGYDGNEFFHLSGDQYNNLPVLGVGPTSPNSNGITGQTIIDGDYIYYCIDTNTWKRTQLTSW